MREYVNPPNAITSANLAAGFVALLVAVDGHLVAAGFLVALAALLDALDGRVARRLGIAGHFGSNLDSLADVISFGVVPAVMLRAGPLAESPLLGAGTCLAYVMAGAWRLARFPLVADRPHWVGLPIPAAGLIAATTAAAGPPVVPALALTVAVAILMISTLPFPTLLTLATLMQQGPARRHRDDTRHVGRRRALGVDLRSKSRRNSRSGGRGLRGVPRPSRVSRWRRRGVAGESGGEPVAHDA